MATSILNPTMKRETSLAKSSESGNDSSYSAQKSTSRRRRSLSRVSHRMQDPDIEVTPARKEKKFVNTMRGSEFGEISLHDLATEFFESFSEMSEISSGERGRSGSRNSVGGGDVSNSQRRGRSISRVSSGSNGVLGRLSADTESSRRRRSLSRQPSSNRGGSVRAEPVSNNLSRRRSVSRQPKERVKVENGESAIGGDNEKANLRRRRSLSVCRPRIENSEGDVDQSHYSSNSKDVKSFTGGKSQDGGSQKSTASDQKQGLKRSFSQKPIKYHDDYSSYSSAITDDERKDSSSSKHGTERIITTVYTQNKGTTPKKRDSLGNADYGSQQKPLGDGHGISTVMKGCATKLQESEERKRALLAEIIMEEQRGRELSENLKELLTENNSDADEKLLQTRRRSKAGSRGGSRRMSMGLTDEAEQFIDEFISNIEDGDFLSLEDEQSESSSSFGMRKIETSQDATVLKSVPVEMDGVNLPWLEWETPDDTSVSLSCLHKSAHTPNSKSIVNDSDTTQDASSGQGTSTSIGTISSKGSWSPNESATKPVKTIKTIKVDVAEYLKRPNTSDILNETWKVRNMINSGSLVLCSRSLI